jgi:hypothetical protein
LTGDGDVIPLKLKGALVSAVVAGVGGLVMSVGVFASDTARTCSSA